MLEENKEYLSKMWHSTAHLLALAVQNLFGKDIILGIGPAIDEGFYYDFDYSFKEEDLKKIEKEMKKLAKKKLKFERKEISKEEAKKIFAKQPFKLELLEEIPENKVSIYTLGSFVDLCKGPHLEDTSQIKAIKLFRLAGAYWKGNEKNKMLSRIYGISFPSKEELDSFLKLKEEAKKRNHVFLGKQLELYSFHPEAPGMVFFHPKGAFIYNQIVSFARKLQKKYKYNEVITPQILSLDLWKQSGHFFHYKDNMFFTNVENKDFAIKPMNCPGHILIYKTKRHSYKDLPVKYSEFGVVHRFERSGTLNGLLRLRRFTQDDAHIFCYLDILENELSKVLDFADEVYSYFGFSYEIDLSTRPEKRMGSEELWDKAEKALSSVLDKRKLVYKINEGDGAFYGPKIDFHIKDSLGRKWQCATIQLDFQMPEKFDLNFINSVGQKEKAIMIHHTILGSVERFMGVLVEHFGGKFPFWLSPYQIAILPVSDKNKKYALDILNQLPYPNVSLMSDGSLGKRIREAELKKYNYILVLGDKEEESKSVAVRFRDKEQKTMPFSDFLKLLEKEQEYFRK